MSNFQTLLVNIDARGVAYVTLNRAEKRNALSGQMIAELTAMAQSVGASDDVRVIVLNGAGKVFCAGADLGWMKTQIGASPNDRMVEARKLASMLHSLNEMPTPMISRIHGSAFGGGIGLACICDVAIADDATSFGFTETKLGLIPATIAPYAIARMGEANARRVFMSARIFGAFEACELGIIAKVSAANQIDDAIEAEVSPYLSVAPKAVGAAKALARSLGPRIDADVIDATIRTLADVWEREEAKHGIDSFLHKRPARWT